MNALNLENLVSNPNYYSFRKYLKIFSNIEHNREEEYECLKSCFYILKQHVQCLSLFDGFSVFFSIKNIGKEFDLLKANNDICLNIEIKSQLDLNSIANQLEKNNAYLKFLSKEIFIFAFVSSTNEFYKLRGKDLIKVDVDEIVHIIKSFNSNYFNNLNEKFTTNNYLVSPTLESEKFLNEEYCLTSDQSRVFNEILKNYKNKSCMSIVGHAGSGKTLLSCKLAIEFSKKYNVSYIFCGPNYEEYKKLFSHIHNIEVLSAKDANTKKLQNIVIIDEAQRIYPSTWTNITKTSNQDTKILVFYDSNQTLSKKEANNKVWKDIQISSEKELIMSKNIRNNIDVQNFCEAFFCGKKFTKSDIYKHVNIQFCKTEEAALDVVQNLTKQEYVFINYTGSYYKDSAFDKYACIENVNTHNAIGKDYENVCVVLNDDFYFEDNKIKAKEHPTKNYQYCEMLKCALTRSRNKIYIVVESNENLYLDILELINKTCCNK